MIVVPTADAPPRAVAAYLLELLAERRAGEIDWRRVRELLLTYPTARRAGAAALVEAAFGVEPLKDASKEKGEVPGASRSRNGGGVA